jgi:hypothetical protein
MARPTDLADFPALALEGNLIAPAMLARIARGETDAQTEPHYAIPQGLTLRDEIARYFRIGQAHHDRFARLEAPSQAATVRFAQGLLAEAFGFADLTPGANPVALAAGAGRVPVVVVPAGDPLDRPSPALTTDGRRRSAASALQDRLNAEDAALWGLATNGAALRLMRDNASLTRPAYIEADLAQIFGSEDFASFAALWLLLHRSRFGTAGPAADCPLEHWRERGSREGEAARDRLRDGVEAALKSLGTGFLEANPDLRARLAGHLDLTQWFNQLLRLVYRLIFLMVAEDRDLLHAPGATPRPAASTPTATRSPGSAPTPAAAPPGTITTIAGRASASSSARFPAASPASASPPSAASSPPAGPPTSTPPASPTVPSWKLFTASPGSPTVRRSCP